MRYEVALHDTRVRVEVAPDGRFLIDDRVVAAELRERETGRQWLVLIDGASHEVTLLTSDPLRLDVDGVLVAASVRDERAVRADRGASSSRLPRFAWRRSATERECTRSSSIRPGLQYWSQSPPRGRSSCVIGIPTRSMSG